jgi:lipopolysaccharide transport system ATP-binding protein
MTAIRVENIGKRYRLGDKKEEPYETFRNMLWNGAKNSMRRLVRQAPAHAYRDFWALRDISFEVKQGERVGIIGRNGAGKSTLLKLLSRITEPTEGRIAITGRVGSLLEVGTGFHPELTGRENIYLNGAVLGMAHTEIRRKFDEIVDFSGIEGFLDTPVKRYSSGMYVRLAFAVAAHLEPDVLIIDEVLAVGDAAFQKKCLGKMDEFGRSGRTILFVSHSMGAITQMCSKCALLQGGRMAFFGDTAQAAQLYMGENTLETAIHPQQFQGPLRDNILFEKIDINGSFVNQQLISPRDPVAITIRGRCMRQTVPVRIIFSLYFSGARIATLCDVAIPETMREGEFEAQVTVPPFVLRPGEYGLRVGAESGGPATATVEWSFSSNDLLTFTVIEEWSEENDMGEYGMVNIPYDRKRS